MQEIHDLAYHGQGGFPISDVWDMPIPYRRYHIRAINKYQEERLEQIEEAKGKTSMNKSVNKPNIPQKPTYSTNLKS